MTQNNATRSKKYYIPFLLIFLIDALFFYKYGSRIQEPIWLIMAGYLLLKLFIPLLSAYYKHNILFYALITAYMVLGIFVLSRISPLTLNVDRWDAIVAWWDGFFEGKFPYAVRTRFNGFPSPLPFLQLIYLPFYLLAEIGWLQILISVSFLLAVRRLTTTRSSIMLALTLITSAALWWELCVRSTLFVNSVLAMVTILFIAGLHKQPTLRIIIAGLMTGFLLSTRLVTVIPLMAVCVYVFLKPLNVKPLLLFLLISITGFILTFAILLPWNLHDFLANNPFAHHDRHMPRIFTFIFLAAAIAIGWFSQTTYQLILSSGILLFFIAIIFVSLEIDKNGLESAYLGSKADISYFILSFAFLIFSLLGDEVVNKLI